MERLMIGDALGDGRSWGLVVEVIAEGMEALRIRNGRLDEGPDEGI